MVKDQESMIICCDRCGREIETKEDLVVSTYLFIPVPYHAECFGREINSERTFIVNNHPLNAPLSTMIAYICLFIGIICLVSPNAKLLSIPLLFIALLRGYVWWKFERHIRNRR